MLKLQLPKYLLFSLFVLLLSYCFAQPYQPVANPAAIITAGPVRFTLLSERVIRMEYAPDSVFNDLATITFLNRNLPVPKHETTYKDGHLLISTAFLQLNYTLHTGNFNAKNLSIRYNDPEQKFTWHPGLKDKQNLKGTTRTLDGTSGKFSFQTMKKVKADDGIISRSGWALIDDSHKPGFDNSDWPWVQNSTTPANTDWYFFGYGTDYKAALLDFTNISGKISLPPKFAFGVWYSRYYQYTEQDFKDIVTGYENHGLPLDVLVIDMDWHQTKTSDPDAFAKFKNTPDDWTGFTWSKKYFPDYAAFLQWTNEKNIQTCLNLHPASGVQPHETTYCQFAGAMGIDTAGCPAIPFNITNKQFAKNYFDVLLHPYEKAGVDFWWLDWQQYNNTGIKGVNPTFYLNYVHFSDMQRQGKRPLIFHRYGGLGNQRYQIGFSGDVVINWKSLAYQPGFTATAANVGFGFWSHDIGGHMNPVSKSSKQDPELFTRWVQWGTFSPIFRTHATNDPGIERRMWEYPAANFAAMKKAVLLRYSLLPYIYTYSRMAYDSGVSLMRPMYYEHPAQEIAYHCPGQYYFGDNLIVAPVTKPLKGKGTAEQTVWLPAGNWYDFRNNNLLTGGQQVKLNYGLDEIPVFVKQGSIIPTQQVKQHIAESVLDTVILTIYTGSNGSFNLYEDDGTTDNYRKNVCSFTAINFSQSSTGMQLTITPDEKEFIGQVKERAYRLQFINCVAPEKVLINGVKTNAKSYDAATRILWVYTDRVYLKKRMKIEVVM